MQGLASGPTRADTGTSPGRLRLCRAGDERPLPAVTFAAQIARRGGRRSDGSDHPDLPHLFATGQRLLRLAGCGGALH